MNWQTSYTINDDLKETISDICNKKLKGMPDDQEVWHRTSHITLNSYTWSFYKAEGLNEVKEQLKIITGFILSMITGIPAYGDTIRNFQSVQYI